MNGVLTTVILIFVGSTCWITNTHMQQSEERILKAIEKKFVVTSPTITTYPDAIVYRDYDTSQFIHEEENNGTIQ